MAAEQETKVEAVKKPVGGAFSVFTAERREEFKKQADAAGDKSAVGPVKLASAAWKAMSDAEKAPYEARYQEAKAKYEAYKASDDFVAPERKVKKGEKEKAQKDKDAPKRPAGGAYGQFVAEKREEFKAKAVAAGDTSFGGPAKLASEAWKAIGEAEKAEYEKKYQAAKAKYEEDMAAYKASKPAEAASSPEKASPKAAGKRKAAASPTEPAAKKGRGAKAAKPAARQAGPEIDAAVLKEAEGCGMRGNLENLAARKEVAEKGFESAKLLKALQAADGLVNKAKAALLGGA